MRIVIVALAMLLLGGCSLMRSAVGYQDPTVNVGNVRFLNADFEKIDLALDLDVNNPNAASAALKGYDYDVTVEGSSLVSGTQDSKLVIPAKTNALVSVPVSLKYASLYQIYQTLTTKDSFAYNVLCGLKFDAPVIGSLTVPIKHQGILPVVKMPTIALDNMAVKSLNLTGANIEFALKVTNPNAFNVLVNSLQYTLDVNGANWATGTTAQPLSIKENGDSVVAIPVSLNFLKVGGSVAQALTGGKPIKYDLKSMLDVNTSNPYLKKVKLPLNRTGEFKIAK